MRTDLVRGRCTQIVISNAKNIHSTWEILHCLSFHSLCLDRKLPFQRWLPAAVDSCVTFVASAVTIREPCLIISATSWKMATLDLVNLCPQFLRNPMLIMSMISCTKYLYFIYMCQPVHTSTEKMVSLISV